MRIWPNLDHNVSYFFGMWLRPFVLMHDGIEWLGFYTDNERECTIPNSFPEKFDEECVKQLRETFHKRAI